IYRILIFSTRGGPRCTQPAGTAALNSACPSFGRNAVRPLRRDLRGAILSPLRHTGLDDVPAVGGPGKSGRLAVPPVWHLVRRELLPEVRPPEGRLGSPSSSPVHRPAHPHDPVDARDRRIRPVRGHGFRGTRRQPEPAGPEHSRDAFRSNREQRHGLQRELELRFMGHRVEPKIAGPGQYYLKVAFIVDGATGAVDVGLDNVRLTWTTDAGVVLYVPAPLPLVVFVSQDKTVFLSYYALIAAAIFLIGGFYAVRERRETLRVLKAPIEAIGTRLRSRSAWVAVGQVWMAVTFFQVAVIFVISLIGIEPTSPIN